MRFLRAEGGALEADRLERSNTFGALDSVIFTAALYEATIAQVGQEGPRAFSKSAGLRLEFVPLNDPGYVHVGDTLHACVLGNGAAVPPIGIDGAAALVTTATPPTSGTCHAPPQCSTSAPMHAAAARRIVSALPTAIR